MLNQTKHMEHTACTQDIPMIKASAFDACFEFLTNSKKLRSKTEKKILYFFKRAFTASPDDALKFLFFVRDIKGGFGERRVFRVCICWLATNHPQSISKNIPIIPELGRYDDLLVLLDTPCQTDVVEYIRKTLESDETKMLRGEPISILSKWLPSVNASNHNKKRWAKLLAKNLGMTEKTYRKKLSAMRNYLDILERRLCKKDYSFSYEEQPSTALYKYRKAFLRHDYERFVDFITDTVYCKSLKPAEKVVHPYEITCKANDEQLSKREINLLDTKWTGIPSCSVGENAIALIASYLFEKPLSKALSLGIYFAERNKGHFHDCFISSTDQAELIKLQGKTIVDKVRSCTTKLCTIRNSNFYNAFALILSEALKHNLPQGDLPKTIYVVSNYSYREDDFSFPEFSALHDGIKKLYAKYGYQFPKVVYWILNSPKKQFPVVSIKSDVTVVFGVSPIIFKMLTSQYVSPYEFMFHILNDERYSKISL